MSSSSPEAIADLGEAEAAIAALIAESAPLSCFGVVRIELEPNSQLARLDAAEFARLAAAVARVLDAQLRPGDRLFTDRGWTWLVLLPRLVSPAHLTLALVRLLHGLEEQRSLYGARPAPIVPVLGGAFYPDSAGDAHGLLAMARLATFDAWRSGERFRVGMRNEDSHARHLSDLSLRIPAALQGDLFEIHLQPQVVSRSGACTSVEALLRWQDGDGRWVAPPLLIAAIERAGLRPAFNRWLIQRTLRCARELDAQGIVVDYSINLVAADIQDPELADVVGQALETWEISGTRIAFEITETAMVRETTETLDNLQRLKALGVRISLDDFGTGYSAMTYLRRLPIDELKIDQIFVRRMTESAKDREIVTSIIHLAHQLGMAALAEGVEGIDAVMALRELDCDLMQGHYFSPPLPPPDFAAWWLRRRALPAAD